jgi:thiosulfate dehydrogenase
MTRLAAIVVALVALTGCIDTDARAVGRALFRDPRLSPSEFNAVSCSTCHDDGGGEGAAQVFPGHPLAGTVWRSAWWGGAAPTLKDAVDHCLVFFMRSAPLEREAPASRALYEHLLSISPETAQPPLPLTIVENVTSLPKGDPRVGERVYAAACASCHGDAFTGQGRLNELTSIVPGDSVSFAEQSGFPLALVIIEKVRHGAFFGVSGTMPPFSVEALSDDNLSALIGYLDPL